MYYYYVSRLPTKYMITNQKYKILKIYIQTLCFGLYNRTEFIDILHNNNNNNSNII